MNKIEFVKPPKNKGDPHILHEPKRITKGIEGNGRRYGDFPLFIKDSEGFREN